MNGVVVDDSDVVVVTGNTQVDDDDDDQDATMIDASDFRSVLASGDAAVNHHAAYHHHGHNVHHPHHAHHHPHQSLNGRMTPPGFVSTQGSYATLTPLQPLPPISTMSDKFNHHHYGHHPHQHQHPLAGHPGHGSPPANFTTLMHHMHQSAALSGHPMANLDQSHHGHVEQQQNLLHPNQYAHHLHMQRNLHSHSQVQQAQQNPYDKLAMVSLGSPMSCMASPGSSHSQPRHVSAAVAAAAAAMINGNGGGNCGPSVITSVSSMSNNDLALQSPDRSLGSPCSGYDYANTLREMSSAMASPPNSPVSRSVVALHSPSTLMSSGGMPPDTITTTMANGNSGNDSNHNSPSARHITCSPSPPPPSSRQLTSLTVSRIDPFNWYPFEGFDQ